MDNMMSSLSLPKDFVTPAYLGGHGREMKKFIYNPSNFSDSIRVNYKEISSPGISYPVITYAGGATRRISFEIYLNGRALGVGDDEGAEKVKEWIAHLHAYLPPANGSQFHVPPLIDFSFGWFVKTCVLESMDPIQYQMFTQKLQPLVAIVPVRLIIIQ